MALGDIDLELALCMEAAHVSFRCMGESNVRFGGNAAIIWLGALAFRQCAWRGWRAQLDTVY